MYAVTPGCSIPGCGKVHKAKGLCAMHYRRKQRTGSTDDAPRCHAPVEDRVRRKSTLSPAGCLEFDGSLNDWGYGTVRDKGKTFLAHRVIAASHFGEKAIEGLLVCHRCDNPKCVNIDHLFIGTSSDNAQDREDKGRGHDISGLNNPQHNRRSCMM